MDFELFTYFGTFLTLLMDDCLLLARRNPGVPQG